MDYPANSLVARSRRYAPRVVAWAIRAKQPLFATHRASMQACVRHIWACWRGAMGWGHGMRRCGDWMARASARVKCLAHVSVANITESQRVYIHTCIRLYMYTIIQYYPYIPVCIYLFVYMVGRIGFPEQGSLRAAPVRRSPKPSLGAWGLLGSRMVAQAGRRPTALSTRAARARRKRAHVCGGVWRVFGWQLITIGWHSVTFSHLRILRPP